MGSIKGTRTEKNLLASFAGESQARNRYSYFAKQAKKEGYEQISAIFAETAENEQQHAKTFFRFLEGGTAEITASYPAGAINSTLENLRASADGEKEEHTELYPMFAKIADEEGFPQIAAKYRAIAKVEAEHEKRYRALIDNIENDKVFKKDQPTRWKCRKCGYVHEGPEVPNKCPACDHPQSYYEVKAENY
ncbi:MAG: rubrerythrin family protein [Thermoplasmata archaeon]|nr:rubrerythrin family protein [Thermoplasmata archaeon]